MFSLQNAGSKAAWRFYSTVIRFAPVPKHRKLVSKKEAEKKVWETSHNSFL